ncbi:copper resistance protein CopD [Campylobacter novaezeelandiae]|uniref:copper resistance protein CopD n=1 Tax=Campylobacter novaezeelandiae TaxID=2267891 RepID=UPI0019088BAA|nr:copper resistance protein CopD [Campylobacter novaezeelandiae]MBK1964097.1 copper resistance protein CopD [Campylobacter novaezeelandiae]MBK1994025.1 copper resistance protein CopD [Campylobacter novaezeelandiae]
MSGYYVYILLVHLICAIFFIGYLFVDIFVIRKVKKNYNDFDSKLLSNTAIKIMPFIVLILFLSGGMLASFHFKPLNGYFAIKIILASIIFALVLFSLFCRFIFKKPNPLGKIIHPIVFILVMVIVILAKLMNYFFISF